MTPDLLQPMFLEGLTGILIKVFVLIILLLYTIFAAVLVRQVQIMNRVVALATFSPILFTVAFTHFLLAIGLTLFALLFL